ncbi:hypothetical protein [Priestia endophytica]|uniref:Uncharacterized protein n=1 Tax=Priestia endophytica DSM 13796 TaxID=1121089 RepID=A0A1I6C048_9BACI|nr:hypothetical protein [Priestia endophytica]KYG33457.1 hypothetical protein AZF06_21675 [Priestia endophytica]SFQ86556.1 hypothetical protein SAMN02745910_04667 [Priestia endophytica DSM 13796]
MEFSIEQKNVIHRFYKGELVAFNKKSKIISDDNEWGYFMWKLECELAQNDYSNDSKKYEEELFLILLEDSKKQQEKGIDVNFNYSDELINLFKNTLNEYVYS